MSVIPGWMLRLPHGITALGARDGCSEAAGAEAGFPNGCHRLVSLSSKAEEVLSVKVYFSLKFSYIFLY